MQIIDIHTIDIAALQIETDYRDRGKFARAVYCDEPNNRFIKIWRDDFYYKDFFTAALAAGFYNDIALIEAIIVSPNSAVDTDTRGYATKKGEGITHQTIDKEKYQDLILRVATACIDYNMVYIDMHINNVVEVHGKYYLIDLEAVIPIDKLPQIHSLGQVLEYNDYNYRKLIAPLIPDYMNGTQICVKQHTCNEKEIKYGTANGRIFLEQQYLPTLGGRVLFVGVNYYTDFYCNLVQEPHLFETIDVAEDVINDGSPHGHYVCNILDFELPREELYDHVVFFGILGHTDSDWEIIQTEEEIYRCIEKVVGLVKEGGTLLLGPSTQARSTQFWDKYYSSELLQNYETLTLTKIDINYIWAGKRMT